MNKKAFILLSFVSAILLFSACGSRKDKCPKIGQTENTEKTVSNPA